MVLGDQLPIIDSSKTKLSGKMTTETMLNYIVDIKPHDSPSSLFVIQPASYYAHWKL